MTITYFIAAAAVMLCVPLMGGVIAWCFEQTWKAFVYTSAVVLVLLLLLAAGCWGFYYLTQHQPNLASEVQPPTLPEKQ